jgi:hypothetical protein
LFREGFIDSLKERASIEIGHTLRSQRVDVRSPTSMIGDRHRFALAARRKPVRLRVIFFTSWD